MNKNELSETVKEMIAAPSCCKELQEAGRNWLSATDPEMKKAAMNAIREIAKLPVPAEVVKAAQVDKLEFGPDYVIPKPMDPRLLKQVSRAVAQAAVDSGAATIPMPEHYMED